MEDDYQVIQTLCMMQTGQRRLSNEHLREIAQYIVPRYNGNSSNNLVAASQPIDYDGNVQTCLHCSSLETPEWRKGPDGDHTLCNACGLFYAKLTKRYGEDRATMVMFERRLAGNSHDRRVSF